MILSERPVKMCEASTWAFSEHRALFLDCTRKRSPEISHTEGLLRVSRATMEKNGVVCDLPRLVDSVSPTYR